MYEKMNQYQISPQRPLFSYVELLDNPISLYTLVSTLSSAAFHGNLEVYLSIKTSKKLWLHTQQSEQAIVINLLNGPFINRFWW